MKIFKGCLCAATMVVLLCSFCFFHAESETSITDAERFQQEYTAQNRKLDDHFRIMRTLDINQENPMCYSSFKDVLQRLDNQESFYVYFGFSKCPWCRAFVSPMLTAAKECDVSQILYVNIYTSRDLYILKKGRPVQLSSGDAGYHELLQRFDTLLSDYTLTDAKGQEIAVGEKRIYAPSLIRVQDGKAVQIYTGSSKLLNAYDEITDDTLEDMLTGLRILFGEIE